jgi:hypothetical protein
LKEKKSQISATTENTTFTSGRNNMHMTEYKLNNNLKIPHEICKI